MHYASTLDGCRRNSVGSHNSCLRKETKRPWNGILWTRNGWIMLLMGSIRSIMRRCIRIDNVFFRKPTRPSLPLRKAPPLTPVPLQWSLHPLRFPRFRGTETSGAREKTALRCSEPLRYKVGGPSKVYARFVRAETAGRGKFIIYNL